MRNFDTHFKDLFENTSDLIHFLNIEGDIELVNPSWLKTLGYELHEVVGKSIYDFIHPDFINAYRKCRSVVIQTAVNGYIDTVFVTRSGVTILGDGQIGCAITSDGTKYTRCVFKNMTFRRMAEKKIEISERRLKTYFTSGPDAIIVINQHQEILDWNPKAEIIFGFTADEVSGKPLSETIIPHKYREAHKRGMSHFLKTGEGPVLNKTIEITALHKNGNEFFVNLSISNVMIDGEWLFIAFLSDISDRKRTEESLIKKEAELLQAKLLEDKKNEFISIASHELKTPLTTIKAYTQLALELSREGSPRLLQFLSKVNQSADKLTILVKDLLDVSKIQAGRLKLILNDIHFDSFLSEILDSMQQITADHRIELAENAKIIIRGDSLRLEQVITNIIGNAAKYSPGYNSILVRSVATNGILEVSITDFGIGIEKDQLPLIFTRFFRVDESSGKFGGLGIGLFISSEIVKQHGGTISVKSKPGEGSTFSFTLPISLNYDPTS